MAGPKSVPLDPERVASHDAVLTTDHHDSVHYVSLAKSARLMRRTADRSKGSRVASVMSAVALGWYAIQPTSTSNCYVNRAFAATAVTSISRLAHNPD